MKKILLGFLVGLMMISSVFAIVTPISPSGDETTNANTYDFLATTDDPLFIPIPPTLYVSLGFNGPQQMNCVWNGIDYNCELLEDISAMEGIYPVTMTDNDGTIAVGDLTIDHFVTANDFGFSATGNDISYVPGGCEDTVSGVDIEEAQYTQDDWITVNIFSGNPETLPDGTYDVRGHCTDNAGNEDYTDDSEFTLPANPPVLTDVINLPSTPICGTPATFPCTESFDGGGLPIDISLMLTFDEEASITVILDGGAPIGPSEFYVDHVISLNSLTEGFHILSIEASDGTNSAIYIINLDVINTGTDGDTTIIVRESIPINPTNPAIEIIGSNVEKNNILPGDFAIVRYSLFMVLGEYTRYSFIGDPDFEVPVLVFCENNYDPIAKDIIDPTDENVFTIDPLNGVIDETQPAITCPYTGNIDTGLEYDVLVKYPISANTVVTQLFGTFGVGLYDTV